MKRLRITVTDAQRAGYCVRGLKPWFEKTEGLDFRDMLKNGVPAEDLLATGDANAIRVVQMAVEREWIHGGADGLTITLADVDDSRQCHAGAREFAARHGLNWSSFLSKGISAKDLLATGDREALRIIRDKLERMP